VSARVLKGSNIVLGPYARGDAQAVNTDFVKSSVRPEGCPKDGLPEFSLISRSNVGKSSLLNSLVRRKRLALMSKKPGRLCFSFQAVVSLFGSAYCVIRVDN
jgi:GTP-binding protein